MGDIALREAAAEIVRRKAFERRIREEIRKTRMHLNHLAAAIGELERMLAEEEAHDRP